MSFINHEFVLFENKGKVIARNWHITFECLWLGWIPSADSFYGDARASVLDVRDGSAEPDVQAVRERHWHARIAIANCNKETSKLWYKDF